MIYDQHSMGGLTDLGQSLSAERAGLLQQLERSFRANPSVVAAWVSGSLARGEADDWSDIDLHLAVADEQCAALNEHRRAFVATFGEPLLVQEAPQNAPPGGSFLLVLYRATAAPLEVDWLWQPASSASIPEHAQVLFDRVGLPRSPSVLRLSAAEIAARISLGTTFFWAMAFIATKKILRRQPAAAFDLLRMIGHAQANVQMLLRGEPPPAWGAIASPATRETLPPLEPAAQLTYLHDLVTAMTKVQQTTDGVGGLVTEAAVEAVQRLINLTREELVSPKPRYARVLDRDREPPLKVQ